MPTDLKHEELKSLRIDRSARRVAGERFSRRWIVIGVAIIAVLALLALASRLFGGGVVTVETALTSAEEAGQPAIVLNATGYIVAHHKINVNSKVTGRVAWIGVEKGDKVKQGDVLVRLEDDEFRAQVAQARGMVLSAEARLKELQTGSRPEEVQRSESDLNEARASLANARASLNRVRPLVNEGVLSKADLDLATAQFEAAQSRVNSLERVYTLAKIGPRAEHIEAARGELVRARGQLALAESYLDATQIRAPVDGTILERTAEKGELITTQFASAAEGGPRGSVVSLADLNDLQVELDIAQSDIARLTSRQKAIVFTDAFPEKKYQGEIEEISPEANRQKATVQVKVKVLNPDELLKPDMNASVQFLSPKPPDSSRGGVLVPLGGVRDREGKKIVWVVEDGRARVKSIEILEPRSTGYLATGVKANEQVIVNPPATLSDGDKVSPKENK